MVWRCPSIRPSVRLLARKNIDAIAGFFFKFGTQVCLGVPSVNLLFVLSYLIKYAHKSIINDFSILVFIGSFVKLEPSNIVHFDNLRS